MQKSRRFRLLFLVALLDVWCASNVVAADFHVPTNYTLSGAITAAGANDNIVIDSDVNSDLTLSPSFDISKVLNYKSNNPLAPSAINMYLSTAAGANRHFNFLAGATGSTFSDLIIKSSFNPTGTAVTQGGAIVTNGAALGFTNVKFNNNRALNLGGAIYSDGGALNINAGTVFDSSFVATGTLAATTGLGGAIYAANTNIAINGASFTNNLTLNLGGAIYSTNSNMTITGATVFQGNRSTTTGSLANTILTGSGGAILFTGNNVTLDINGTSTTNVLFSGNRVGGQGGFGKYRSAGSGGALYIDGLVSALDTVTPGTTVVNLDYVTFSGNSTAATTGGIGGAVFINNATVNISNSSFISNTANGMGAALFNGDGGFVTITDSLFDSNSGTGHGSAIQNAGKMNLVNVNFNGNTSPNAWGAVANTGNFNNGEGQYFPTMTVTGGRFYRNVNTVGGGAFTNGDNGVATVTGTIFQENSGKYGGGLYNETVITLNNVTFLNNTSPDSGGAGYSGAVYAIGDRIELNLNNSTLTGNTAALRGGGLYLDIQASTSADVQQAIDHPEYIYPTVNTTTITGTAFTGNGVATTGAGGVGGGAIYAEVLKGGSSLVIDRKLVLDVSDTTFTNNYANTTSASSGGGALYLANDYRDVANNKLSNLNSHFTNVSFDSNTSTSSGGAIFQSVFTTASVAGGATLTSVFDDVDFVNNSALRNFVGTGITGVNFTMNGGAFYNSNAVMNFNSGVTFTGNSSRTNVTNVGVGTAALTNTVSAYSGAGYNVNAGLITVGANTEFDGNYALVNLNVSNLGTFAVSSTTNALGGGLLNSGTGSTINIASGVKFTNNYARAESIAHQNGTGNASVSANAYGGAIYNSGILNIADSVLFSGNSASAITTVTAGGLVTANTINAQGGAIYNSGATAEASIIGLEKTGALETRAVFNNNSVAGSDTLGNGGAIWNSGKLTVDWGVFNSNIASGHGGAVYSTTAFTITNSEFTGNSATGGSGGAIFNNYSNASSSLSLDGLKFDTNNAGINGGGVYLSGVNTTWSVKGATFTNNTAVAGGGGLYNLGKTTVDVGTSFTGNHANGTVGVLTEGLGGAIYNGGGTFTVSDDVTFTNNTATSYGGAIYTTNLFTLGGATFTGNTSDVAGGAIYMNQTAGTWNLNGAATFTGNSSLDGGAIYLKPTTNISNLVSFTSNSATQNGGAIYVNSGATTINGASFTNNDATTAGGAVYVNTGALNINGGTTFTGNTTTGKGGAIYSLQNVTLASTTGNITFSGNTANGIGNDIHIGGTTARTITVNGTANDVTINGGFSSDGASASGNHAITKTGLGNLLVNGDSSNFVGTANVGAGAIIVSGTGKWINGLTTVSGTSANNTLLRITGDSVYEKVTVSSTGTFEHISNSLLSSNIDNANIKFSGVGGTIKFMADASLGTDLAKYKLLNHIAVGNNANTVVFQNSDVTFGTNNFTSGTGTLYSFNNSIINLSNGTSETTSFAKVGLSNATLSFDAGFKTDGTLESDKLTITTLSGDNTIKLGSLSITGGQNDSGISNTYSTVVLNGTNLNFDSSSSSIFKSDIYEYLATVSGKTLTLTTVGAASENSLYIANAKLGTRAFNMAFFGAAPYTYHIGQSLSPTATGAFGVNGNSAATSIISGVLVDNTGTPIGGNGSFFDVVGATNFTLSNVSVVDALKNGNGAVLSVTGAGSTNTLTNIILARNISNAFGGAIYNEKTISLTGTNALNQNSGASGGAIYNASGATITAAATSFGQNSATNNGGAIYNAGTLTFNSAAQFTSNSAASGGAIYNTGTATIIGGTNFTNNNATTDGGAIWNSGTIALNSTAGNIVFSGNTATGLGADIYNSNGIVNINGTANDVVIGGGIGGLGTINKTGAGRLLINGNSGGYTGTFAQTAGTTIFTNTMFGGAHNISGGILELAAGGNFATGGIVALSSAGTFNITTGSNLTIGAGAITGFGGTFGTVNKSGSGDLTINGSNAAFTGTFNQTAGRTIVGASGTMFAGTNNISNSILQISSPTVYERANIGNNGQLIHIVTMGTTATINNGVTNLRFTGTGGTMSFGADGSLSNGASYNLAAKIDNGNLNNVVFNDSNVFMGTTDYTGSTRYAFNNSTIDLNSGTLSTVNFSNTNLNNTKLSFDVRFDLVSGNPVLSSDTFNAGNLLGDTTIGIGIIRVLNDDADTGLVGTYNSSVLSNSSSLLFNGSSDTMFVSTNVYEYAVTTNGREVLLTVDGAADRNSLYRMNDRVNKRGFNISYFSGSTVYYNIGQSLGTTKDGEFIVQGFDSDPAHGVISGAIVDANGDPTGTKGSFFKLTGSTVFTLKNLTIEDAYTADAGSVLYMTNALSSALLENLIIQNNESVGNGGAIYTTAGSLSIANTLFDSNTSGANGGAIYNSSTIAGINAAQFTDNTATLNGGAIYNTGTATFANLVEFVGNTAVDGAAIYNTGTVNFSGATNINANIASGNGGAIYVANGSTLNMNNNASVTGNSATAGLGGAVYVAGNMNLGGNAATTMSFSGNTDSTGNNDIYIASTGVLAMTGGGYYDFDNGIAGDTGSKINVTGSGARMDADMSSFFGQFTQSGASVLSQIFGTLNANYTITNGVAKFMNNALETGKTITVNGNGVAQFNGAGSNNLGTVIGTGTLIVANTLTNTGTIDVASLQINAATVNNGTIDSDATILTAAVTNNATISGTGTTTVRNGASLVNIGTVQQNKLIIDSGAIARSNASDMTIANGITNNGTLTFNGGTNANVIAGAGKLFVTGDVTNSALITQTDIEITSTGEFDSDISKIAISNPITNEGDLNLLGNGNWTTNIVGTTGITSFDSGTVNNTATIQQSGFIVKSNGVFNTDGDLIQTGADGITVNGVLNIARGDLTVTDVRLTGVNASDIPTLDLRSTSSVPAASALTLNTITADTGSRIYMDIFADGRSDVINISGAAVLNGELYVRAGVGSYRNLTFTLMNASSLSGDLINDITSGNTPTLAFIDASNITDARYDYLYDATTNTITLFFNGINMSHFTNMSGLTFNQREVAAAMDEISKTVIGDLATIINDMIDINDEAVVRDTLSELSPYFIANILRPNVDGANRSHIYGRMKNYCKNGCNSNGLWADGGIANAQFNADENSIGSLTSNTTGIDFGYDHYFGASDIVLGVFGTFAPQTVTQESHSADIQTMGAGVYFGLLKNTWDLKTVADFNMNTYSTSRRIHNAAIDLDRTATADFGGTTMDLDLEFGYKIGLTDTLKLRPFVGGGAQMLSYDAFTETGANSLDMDVAAGSNLGSAARAGIGFEQKLSKFSWYASGEYNAILTGNYIDLTTKFAGTNTEFKSRGVDVGTSIIGINAGADYNVGGGLNANITANYRMGDQFTGYGARVGLRYTFCGAQQISAAEYGRVTMMQPIARTPDRVGGPYYATNKYKLTDAAKGDLRRIANLYKKQGVKFVVEGHADSRGAEKHNLDLSSNRAKVVADYLKDQGIDPDKIEYRGVGAFEPIDTDQTPSGRVRNRRVDIFMYEAK